MVMVFSLKSSTALILCNVCLPMMRSYKGAVAPASHTKVPWLLRRTLLCRGSNELTCIVNILQRRESNLTHLICFQGAI